MAERPRTPNADDWSLYLEEMGVSPDCQPFLAVQICEAIEEISVLYMKAVNGRREFRTALKRARREIERLQKLIVSGEQHDEDCDFLNLSGELVCNCSGGRARAAMSDSEGAGNANRA